MELEDRARVSVRLDPALSVEGRPTGKLHRDVPDVLVFKRGREETGRVSGDPERLDLLTEIVGTGAIDDVGSLLLPKDLDAFSELARNRAEIVAESLAEGRVNVERVERLVCALYGLPDELTETVVQHAVERAAR